MGSPLFFSKILTSSPSISSCLPLQRSPPSSRQTESSWLITVMRLRWCMLWVWPCTTGVANAGGYFCFLDTCVHVYTKMGLLCNMFSVFLFNFSSSSSSFASALSTSSFLFPRSSSSSSFPASAYSSSSSFVSSSSSVSFVL